MSEYVEKKEGELSDSQVPKNSSEVSPTAEERDEVSNYV